MKKLKGTMFVLLVLLVLVGLSYVYASGSKIQKGSTSVVSSTGHTRDFERNIYVVETNQKSVITYSVTQAKDMTATLNGMSPSNILVHQGDTVKLVIDSEVNCDFIIDGYQIRARTQPLTQTEVQFNADLEGIYPYRCDGFLEQEIGFIEVVR